MPMQNRFIMQKILLSQLSLFFMISSLFVYSFCHANSVKIYGASGKNEYKNFGISTKWKLNKVAKIRAAIDSSESSGNNSDELKLGYISKINDITSYEVAVYGRNEPSDVKVIGISPEFNFDYESMGFFASLDFSRTSTTISVAAKKNANQSLTQSFATTGLSLGLYRYFFEVLRASFSGSFYTYSEPQTRFPTINKNFSFISTASGLSATGYPERAFSLGLYWEIDDQWSSAYSLSSSKTHFDGLTIIYSGLGIDYSFTKEWAFGVGYNWSSSTTTSGSLEVGYTW